MDNISGKFYEDIKIRSLDGECLGKESDLETADEKRWYLIWVLYYTKKGGGE